MKGILGVYFVVKQEQRTKELVEMILLWLISLSVITGGRVYWPDREVKPELSECSDIESVAVMVLVSVMGGYWVVVWW